jgi:hypothetical protein
MYISCHFHNLHISYLRILIKGKTTNAAILFRAADYIKALETAIEKNEEELAKLQTQYSALEMILQQYENFSIDAQTNSVLQLQMVNTVISF